MVILVLLLVLLWVCFSLLKEMQKNEIIAQLDNIYRLTNT